MLHKHYAVFRAVPSGGAGGGGGGEQLSTLEIRQSDYNALVSVCPPQKYIRESISALPPCSKNSRCDTDIVQFNNKFSPLNTVCDTNVRYVRPSSACS